MFLGRNRVYNISGKKLIVIIFCALVILALLIISPQQHVSSSRNKTVHQTVYNGIVHYDRGYWSGDAVASYHSNRFGPKLAGRLVDFFKEEKAASVADLGGGGGQYSKALIENGVFASCYDGDPSAQDVSHGVCASVDLTKPMNMTPHDWVLSLSVGRQIPPHLVNDFVSNVHHMNTKGIVMYWGDGRPEKSTFRKSVLNNDQVIEIFAPLGYVVDPVAQNYLRKNELSNYSIIVFRKVNATKETHHEPRHSVIIPHAPTIKLAVTSCGTDKMEEALTFVKSAIIFAQHTHLKVFVFVDSESIPVFTTKLVQLRNQSRIFNKGKFEFRILPAEFPPASEGALPWEKMFKSCSLQRMFLPALLPEEDTIIYFDADTIILGNLTDFWSFFYTATNQSTVTVASLSTEFPKKSWFQKHPEFPHYGERGLNTGITLMNLTRMREVNFEKMILEVRDKYEALRPIESGDQFLQNILYSFHPELVSLFPCDWNLRRLHCSCKMATLCGCKSALENGVAVIHGTANTFTDETRLPMFRDIFNIFKTHNLEHDNLQKLMGRLNAKFPIESGGNQTCFFTSPAQFYRRMKNYAAQLAVL